MADRRRQPFYISQIFTTAQKSERDYKVQMNPGTAVMRNRSRLKMQQLAGLTAIIFIFAGLWTLSFITRPPVDIRATFNFQHSLVGRIISVDRVNDSFSVAYQSSTDKIIIETGIRQWSVTLVPGKSVTRSKEKDHACYLIDNLSANLAEAAIADCNRVVVAGRLVLMDYLFLNIHTSGIVVRSVIGQK